MSCDITEKFTRAASALVTGELVKDEYFTLFEAVGALELTAFATVQIMDSKMDSGYLAPGETLDHNYDVMRELLPEEVLGIMDQLLCYEVAWHMGHPLSQTLFTSIYLDHLLWPVPKSLDDAVFNGKRATPGPANGDENVGGMVTVVLRAYCLALIKACGFVHERVASEFYYEEEDFSTQLYSRKLLPDVKIDKIIAVLDNAIEWLNQETKQMDEAVKAALLDRLIFRRHLLDYLAMDLVLTQSRSTKSLTSMLDQISLIQKSIQLGKSVEDAFSEKLQRRLASTVPPRPIIKIESQNAISYLKRFCQDAIDLQEILDSCSAFSLYNLLWTLQSRKPQPSVYIRSLAQSLLLLNGQVLGILPAKKFCCGSMKDLVLPFSPLFDPSNDEVEAPSSPKFQIAKQMDVFIQRMAQPFIDSYRTICLNRCRIRRTLCHNIVDWDRLQAEAEECDTQLRTWTLEAPIYIHGDEPTYTYPLSSWTYHYKLQQMRLVIQLGFELSVYSSGEFQGMYWYLSHLCSTHLVHLDRIRACVITESQRALSRRSEQSRVDMETRIKARDRTLNLLDRISTELGVTDAFSIALHALYTLLSRHGLISLNCSSSPGYSASRLRYELRMKPFLPISLPEVAPFEIYEREATLDGESDRAVLNRAVRATAEAKKGLERYLADGPYLTPKEKPSKMSGLESDWIKNAKNMLRACIATSIAIDTVKKAILSKDPSKPLNLSVEVPEVGSQPRWHDWWAVPQVSEAIPLRGPKEATD
ncbi:conserved hypothetical protein [Microsporum canis CBS 113480]|uniref:Amino-acid N-acetyltransferase subunit Mak10 n=1 Tax=Arthroderma otae (strain ATCC MYA-4605 / CBS 113480) TaxID=554155 RepID=C5FVS0_ARTOC|nr:conserved hypothetical protein [Microsporum canis CBS 113480]EEQ34004.1 conserved hypothetical protein [Microsporum canis CBS 113480]